MLRTLVFGLALTLALGGCTDFRRALGLEKAPPDEFTVVQNAPLSLPPDYGLRPPHSAGKPATPAPMQEARLAVFKVGQRTASTSGGDAQDVGGALTPGEQALLTKAGAVGADGSIRQVVDAETQQVATASDSFVDSLLFWRSPPVPGAPVDATGEAKRVEADQAEGKPVTTPQPTVQRTQRTLLEGLF